MFNTILWVTWLFIYMAVRMPIYWRVQFLKKHGRTDESQALLKKHGQLWVRRLFKHVGIRIHMEGTENLPKNGEPVLFVSNHQSYVDIPVFMYDLGRPHPLMAKSGLKKVPFLAQWMKALDCVFVERDDIRAAAAALKEGEHILKSGKSLIVCPEGTRSKSSDVAEFKAGSVRMALRTGVPIIPLALEGTAATLEANQFHLRGGDIHLKILPMVHTEDLSREEQKELPARLRDMIIEAKAEFLPS